MYKRLYNTYYGWPQLFVLVYLTMVFEHRLYSRDALDLLAVGRIQEGLDKVNWTLDAVQGVETAWLNATQEVDCDGDDVCYCEWFST